MGRLAGTLPQLTLRPQSAGVPSARSQSQLRRLLPVGVSNPPGGVVVVAVAVAVGSPSGSRSRSRSGSRSRIESIWDRTSEQSVPSAPNEAARNQRRAQPTSAHAKVLVHIATTAAVNLERQRERTPLCAGPCEPGKELAYVRFVVEKTGRSEHSHRDAPRPLPLLRPDHQSGACPLRASLPNLCDYGNDATCAGTNNVRL
jgi:hypothetical protein